MTDLVTLTEVMLCRMCLEEVKSFPTYIDEVNPTYDEYDCPRCGYHNLKFELKDNHWLNRLVRQLFLRW